MGIGKYLGIDKVTDVVDKMVTDKDEKLKVMAEVEKERLKATRDLMGKAIERKAIPSILFVYSAILVSNFIVAPYLSAFTGILITTSAIPTHLTTSVNIIISGLLAKKVGDKIITKDK